MICRLKISYQQFLHAKTQFFNKSLKGNEKETKDMQEEKGK